MSLTWKFSFRRNLNSRSCDEDDHSICSILIAIMFYLDKKSERESKRKKKRNLSATHSIPLSSTASITAALCCPPWQCRVTIARFLFGSVVFETLPKAQRTRGLSSAYQSNFLRSYHKFLHKSWSNVFRISTKHQLQNLNQTWASP